ncbi:hypothetical protein O181_026695 [Austropuccinia psidii MF-1]|uniref:Uncharacterized protein n=1 Tax=Austropuccinia psidii MF-1 TaxID=1389203 RepID=A0A9Q3CPW4_9BASI|nr:hypothetical protein [Austropuccinia psidii MF-1]
MKPQPQGHSLDNPYQEDIKPDVLLDNKSRSPSKYLDGDNMTYSEKEELKQLPEGSSWPTFSGIDYWITSRLNTAFKEHPSIWYTQMKEIHDSRNWP